MHDIDIGGTPASEKCAALGITEDFARINRLECNAYIRALQKVYGQPPAGVKFHIRSNRHEFGTYREVAVSYDPANPAHMDYAHKVEAGLDRWSDADFWAPCLYDQKSQAISLIDDLDLLDRAVNPKAFPSRAAFDANAATATA